MREDANTKATKILNILDSEMKAVQKAIKEGKDPSDAVYSKQDKMINIYLEETPVIIEVLDVARDKTFHHSSEFRPPELPLLNEGKILENEKCMNLSQVTGHTWIPLRSVVLVGCGSALSHLNR